MALLEGVAAALAHLHHGGHIDLVEGGQHRGGVLRLDQALRDGLAPPRHAHALLAARSPVTGMAAGGWRRAAGAARAA